MNKNIHHINIKGYDLAIFKVQSQQLHVTIKNTETLGKTIHHSLTFCTVLKELTQRHQATFGTTPKSIHIQEVKRMFDRNESKVIIIIK